MKDNIVFHHYELINEYDVNKKLLIAIYKNEVFYDLLTGYKLCSKERYFIEETMRSKDRFPGIRIIPHKMTKTDIYEANIMLDKMSMEDIEIQKDKIKMIYFKEKEVFEMICEECDFSILNSYALKI